MPWAILMPRPGYVQYSGRVLEIHRQLKGGQGDGTVCSGEDQRTGQAMFSLGEEDGKCVCEKDDGSEEVCSLADCKETPSKA